MWFLWVFFLVIVPIACIILYNYTGSIVERFGWTIPNNCFLVISGAPEYHDTILCYYVKKVDKLDYAFVQINGCLINMNEPNTQKSDTSYSSLRIPRAWILSKKTKIKCFEPEAFKSYVKMITTNNIQNT
jgi:hypothetical protein